MFLHGGSSPVRLSAASHPTVRACTLVSGKKKKKNLDSVTLTPAPGH